MKGGGEFSHSLFQIEATNIFMFSFERSTMLDYSKEKLVELGAEITTREIYQQPGVWQTAFNHYKDQAPKIGRASCRERV